MAEQKNENLLKNVLRPNNINFILAEKHWKIEIKLLF